MATPGRRLDDHTRARAERLKTQGRTVSEIARRLDLSRKTVRQIVLDKVPAVPIESR